MGILLLLVLFFVIMPVLLYVLGLGVMRYTKKAPAWIGFPLPRAELSDKPGGKPPPRPKA